MKRIGGLFDRLGSRQTLAEAFYRAARGKRVSAEMSDFRTHLDERLADISERLGRGAFEFGPYREFRVLDGKSRVIHAPPFEQRVVHHAIAFVCGPVFERGAVESSFACRRGKGHAAALARARHHVNAKEWFLHVDVAAYYDSIEHVVLKSALRRRFRESRLLDLFGFPSRAPRPRRGRSGELAGACRNLTVRRGRCAPASL